jgi:hypothetical protein
VLVLVGGPSGMGKTTFVEHFLASVQARGDAVVLSGRCYERESVPFKGFDGLIDALSRYLVRLPERDSARLVPRQATALCRVFPVLGRVEAIAAAPQRRGLPADVVELRYRAFEALKELLSKLAEERPLILSIDDLQWSDRDSARLLRHLLTPPDPPMLLLVATHRDDEAEAEGLLAVRQALTSDGDGDQVDVRTIALGPLSDTESRRLAQQLVNESERARVSRIAAEAAGSPFLIGELASAPHGDDSPGDLRGAILARVAALPAAERAVLHAMCVATRPVAPELLALVVARHGDHHDVSASLRKLVAARLARQVARRSPPSASSSGRQPVAAYHDRIRETLLEAMSAEALSAWHGRYRVQLEAQKTRDVDALVEHALGAGDRPAAGAYARQAAQQAADALAFDRAVALLETALSHLSLAPAAHAELLDELAQAQQGAGRSADAARTFEAAAELDAARRQEFQRRAGAQFFVCGDIERGENAIRRALQDSDLDYDALIDPNATVARYEQLSRAGFEFERREEKDVGPAALARLDTLWAAALGRAYLSDAPALVSAYLQEALKVGEAFRVARGRALLFLSEAALDPESAGDKLADVLQLLGTIDSAPARAWAALCRGARDCWAGAGDLGLAELLHAEQLLTSRDTPGMTRELNICRVMLIIALSVGRSWADAHALRVGWLRIADETGDRMARAQAGASFAIISYGRAAPERIRLEIQRGLELTDGFGYSQPKGVGMNALVLLDALEGRFDDALARSQRALSTLSGRTLYGLWPRFDRAIVLLAAVARRAGDRDALLDRVAKDAEILAHPRTVFGKPVSYPFLGGCAEFLEGQLAAARGQRDEALALFEQAIAKAHPVKGGYANLFRARHGDLLGGPRGAQMRAEAAASAAEIGVPDRWFELFTTRFEDE